jgi:transposase
MIRLNYQGWAVKEIAKIFSCHEHTVRAALNRYRSKGLAGLWEEKGRGAKRKWAESDFLYLENCLDTEQRIYNSVQLSKKLATERNVHLSSDRIRRLLKKKLEMEAYSS